MSDILENAEMKMMSAIENLESNLHTLRTGRASSAMLDRIEVDYYGAPTPINQMARINVVEGTQLVIKPYDRSLVKAIVHAVQASNLGLNPQGEGDLVRIQVPTLTEDRRKELAKEAQKFGENAKVAIRNIRRDANDLLKKLEKGGEITEDELADGEDQIQKLTDKMIAKVDKAVEEKTAEIMTV